MKVLESADRKKLSEMERVDILQTHPGNREAMGYCKSHV